MKTAVAYYLRLPQVRVFREDNSSCSRLGVGFAALSSVHTRPATAAGSAPVTVINTPLPVQGTVGVNNFPTSQTVNGTVDVGNFPSTLPVSFSNTSGSPMYVRDVDNGAHNPVLFIKACGVPPGGSTCSVAYTVPPGSELVIETVSVAFGTANTGERGEADLSVEEFNTSKLLFDSSLLTVL